MNINLELLISTLLIGIGATAIMDLWTLFLKRCFGIPSLNYAMVGRWIGHFPKGQFVHQNIAQAAPTRFESIIGWSAHYIIGIVFAAILLVVWGINWVYHPTLFPALIVGISSIVAPFFIMQPCLGSGFAASKTPKPNIARLKSLATHTSFGLGLYGAGFLTRSILTLI